MNFKRKFLAWILIFSMLATSFSGFFSIKAYSSENDNAYSYTILALSSDEDAFIVNASGVNINGNVGSNSCIHAVNANFNGKRGEYLNETLPDLFDAINERYFENAQLCDDFSEFLGCNNINEATIFATGVEFGSGININAPIRATGDIDINGQYVNVNNGCIVSEAGNVTVDCDNVSLSGLIYLPYGTLTIKGNNVNLNNVCIIADKINITSPNYVNISSSDYLISFVRDNAVYEQADIVIYAMGEYSAGKLIVNWFTNAENGKYRISESNDNINYTDVVQVTGTTSYEYEISDDFELKYIKVSVGRIESIPFIVIKTDEGYAIDLLDTDNDDVPDVLEMEFGTDAENADTDNDGLTDYEEICLTETNPLIYDSVTSGISDSKADNDADRINNITEIAFGTNPLSEDTDGDGLSDYDEANIYKTNPLFSDTDYDGLDDDSEIRFGTDPFNPDSNANGILDGDEYYTQKVINSRYEEGLLEDNMAIPTIEVTAKGDVNKYVEITEYNGYLKGDSHEYIGKVIEISEIDTALGNLNFNLSDTYRIPSYTYGDYTTNGLIICYNSDEITVPLDTDFDEDTRTLKAEYQGEGIYFVIDAISWLESLGVDVEEIIAPSKEAMNISTSSGTFLKAQVGMSRVLASKSLKLIYNEEIVPDEDDITIAGKKIQGQVDIVFVIDTTGSMGSCISEVKSNLLEFVNELEKANIKPYFALVEFRDITCDGAHYTNTKKNINGSNWFKNAEEFKQQINMLSVSGGYDEPETPIDGLEMARQLDMRKSSQKFFVLITDAGVKVANNYGITSLSEMAELLKGDNICTSVVSDMGYKKAYAPLVDETGGVYADIYSDFKDVLLGIANKIDEKTNDGYWTALNGLIPQIIKLDAKPEYGSMVDTDRDGLTDIEEIGNLTPVKITTAGEILSKLHILGIVDRLEADLNININTDIEIYVYNYKSNPVKEDTDSDGLLDGRAIKDEAGNVSVPKDDQPKTSNGYAKVWKAYELQHRHSSLIQTKYDYSNWGLDVTFNQAFADYIVDMLLKNRNDLVNYGSKIRKYVLEFKKLTEGDTVAGAYLLNFIYDTDGRAYHSQPDTWQRQFGYNDFYDDVFAIGSYMHKGRFIFDYGSDTYAIWMWKGDYWNLQSGAEIGLYIYDRTVSDNKQYDAINFEIPMKLSLFNYYRDTTGRVDCLYNWEPTEEQWWITGFNPNYNDANPEYMVSIGRIDLTDNIPMYNAIKENIKIERLYKDIERNNFILDDENHTVWVCFY